jgi:hypothetical protein
MLLPYHVVLPNGHETILLLTELHQKRDFPDAVLVDEESPAQDQADASEGAQESEAAAEPTTQDEKPKTTRRTRKSS